MKIKTFEFNMFPVNCYVVWDEETLQAAVIDAGCYYQEEQQMLKKFIAENGLTVTHLLNTHLHLDVFSAMRLCSENLESVLKPERKMNFCCRERQSIAACSASSERGTSCTGRLRA